MNRYERLIVALLTAALLLLVVYMRSVSISMERLAEAQAVQASPVDATLAVCDRCDYIEGTDGWYEVHVPMHTGGER